MIKNIVYEAEEKNNKNDVVMTKYVVNEDIAAFFKNLWEKNENTLVEDYFKNGNEMSDINKILRKENYYALDKYGLIIRKKEQNKPKSPFGWIFKDGVEFINIHVNILQTKIDVDKKIILMKTLATIKNKFPEIFLKQKIFVKTYSKIFPDIDLSKI
jgi:hypothetical protein